MSIISYGGIPGGGTYDSALQDTHTAISLVDPIVNPGIMKRWGVYVTNGIIKVKIFRLDGSYFRFIGEMPYQEVPGPGWTYNLFSDIPVCVGDYIGWITSSGSGVGVNTAAPFYIRYFPYCDITEDTLVSSWFIYRGYAGIYAEVHSRAGVF